ncbi:hypothetical protein IE5_05793 [Bacillus cereus BAG3X2-2]|uniref:hypothetical protein n=1 Tax=Bacillus cereus TaxID=1396 RepID=UPI0002793606|nr:hypothetical protein [Bacillus cereus]EJQ14178.1 hypothetical protein IE5_05793 [Bacillus cereus BAG3X2-2]
MKKIITGSLCSVLLLTTLGTGSAFAAQNVETSNLSVNTQSVDAPSNDLLSKKKDLSNKTLNELWSKKEFEAARIAVSHIESFKDADGNLLLKVVDQEGLDKQLKKAKAKFSASELNDAIINFNKVIVEEKGNGELTKFNDQIAEQYKAIDAADPNPKISCSDALGAIGLIHAGSYTAAALLLGISGGLSAGIPFIISTAYYLGSLLC